MEARPTVLRIYPLIIFFLVNAAFSYILLLPWHNVWLFPSFLLTLVCILIGFYQCLRGKRLNLDTIVWVFVYTFFYLAPVVQLGGGPSFPNTMPIDLHDVLTANLVVLVWNFLYLIFRRSAKLAQPTATRQGGRFTGWPAPEPVNYTSCLRLQSSP